MINFPCCVAYVVGLFQTLVRGSPAALNYNELLGSGTKGGGNRDDLWLWGGIKFRLLYLYLCSPTCSLCSPLSSYVGKCDQ